MAIQNTTLSTAYGNIYVSSGASAITAIYLCNAGTVTQAITVYACPSGESLGPEHLIYKDLSLTAGDTYVIDTEKLILSDGDYLNANCTANASVVATVSSIGI